MEKIKKGYYAVGGIEVLVTEIDEIFGYVEVLEVETNNAYGLPIEAFENGKDENHIKLDIGKIFDLSKY